MPDEYNPLDYENLTRNCLQELMSRGPYELPLAPEFLGAGVYALFYKGQSVLYDKIRSEDARWPIYVGKAVPAGGRKGGTLPRKSKALYGRLTEHSRSIQAAGGSLKIEDFLCRYLVVTPLWITMAERFLFESYQPVWNVCVDGFGNHDPGSGRHQGEITWWDALHPGRPWATKLRATRTKVQAEEKLAKFLSSYELKPRSVSLDALEERDPGES